MSQLRVVGRVDAAEKTSWWVGRLGMPATEQAVYYDMRQWILRSINTVPVLVAKWFYSDVRQVPLKVMSGRRH
jgi:hypothetical protein